MNDPKNLNASFGKRLRELRRERGFTAAQLADRLGVSRAAVSQFESGASLPSLSTLFTMAASLGVSVDRLLGVTYTYTVIEGNGVYGIRQICTQGAALCIPDISPDRSCVEALVDKLNRYQVSPCHVPDVVEDALYTLSISPQKKRGRDRT